MSGPPLPDSPAAELARAEAQRISGLRTRLVRSHPFWGYLLLTARLVPSPGLGSFAATDCVQTIWYAPELTCHLTPNQLAFVLLHEVAHHALESAVRRGRRDPWRWNQATDYAINRLVASIARPERPWEPAYMPPDGPHPVLGAVRCLLDGRFDGMVAEQIYAVLEAEEAGGSGLVRSLRLGAGSPRSVTDHGGGLDLHVPSAATEAQRAALGERMRQAQRIQAARERAAERRAGVGAGARSRGMDAAARSRMDWRHLLRTHVHALGLAEEFSLRTLDRRRAVEDLVAPGRIPGPPADVVVAVDTSGSMTDAWLSTVGAELAGLQRCCRALTVLVADCTVQACVPPHELAAWLRQRRGLGGGGGTSHVPVFRWLAERQRRPDLLVGLTDLYTVLPRRAPSFPVLWVTPTDHGPAPWGALVVADPGGRP